MRVVSHATKMKARLPYAPKFDLFFREIAPIFPEAPISCLLVLLTEARDCHIDAARTGFRAVGGLLGDRGRSFASLASFASLEAFARLVILRHMMNDYLPAQTISRARELDNSDKPMEAHAAVVTMQSSVSAAKSWVETPATFKTHDITGGSAVDAENSTAHQILAVQPETAEFRMRQAPHLLCQGTSVHIIKEADSKKQRQCFYRSQ